MSNETLEFNLARISEAGIEQRELELEKEGLLYGVERIQRKIDKRGIESIGQGRKTLGDLAEKTALEINTVLEGAAASRSRPACYKYVSAMNPNVLAHLTTRVALGSRHTKSSSLLKYAKVLGERVQETARHAIYLTAHKEVYGELKGKLKYEASEYKRVRILDKTLEELKFEGTDWPEQDLVRIGFFLLSVFADATKAIEFVTVGTGKKSKKELALTEAGLRVIENATDYEAFNTPFRYPMIVPPRSRTNTSDGGYLSESLQSSSLVMTRDKTINRVLDTIDMPEVYESLNAIQAVPYQINPQVGQVFLDMVEQGIEEAKIVLGDAEELPEIPVEDPKDAKAWIDANPEAFKKLKADRAKIHAKNAKQVSHKYETKQQVGIVKKFYQEAAIYFPHSLDFRSRIYSLVTGFCPQGSDRAKGLLRYAVGKALGENGGYWLAVHAANCFGEDKIDLDARVQWAQDNTELMLSYANAPLENRGWMKVSSPFCFLAACFEWQGFMEQGDSFVSHLPVCIDGSCSGFQHYGALLKHKETCEAVNVLSNGSSPTDIYTEVMNRTRDSLKLDGSPLANEWLPRLVRNIVKHPTMTTPYGVSTRGMVAQIDKAIDKEVDAGNIKPFTGDALEASRFLAPFVNTAIQEVAVAANTAMSWLSELASYCGKNGTHVSWWTPSGFNVRQTYKEFKSNRLDFMYKGQRVQLTLRNDTDRLSRRKSTASLAPNYIHSLDASHLVKTINTCLLNGVDTVTTIHDSFATHAADLDTLWTATRWEFYQQYSGNLLEELYDHVQSLLPDEAKADLPKPPVQSNVNLEDVMYSDYFFA